MSQVMKALQHSEQNYQQHSVSTSPHLLANPLTSRKRYRWYHGMLIVVPSVVVMGVLGYHSYEVQQQRLATMLSLPSEVEQVPAPFESLSYPDFGELKSTYLAQEQAGKIASPQALVDTHQAPVVPETTMPYAATALKPNGETLALDGVDLSELSPALAMRVESLMKSGSTSSRSEVVVSESDAVSLVQNADQFTGRLPEMDFQTHVYTSDVVKRWIRMNGVEYQEGDKLSDSVELVAIHPQTTLIRFKQQLIEIPALYHWKG